MVNRRTLLLGTAGALLLGACGGHSDKPAPPQARTGHLPVPGARLYYEVHGSGPPVPGVLPDAAARQAEYAAVYQTYRDKGVTEGFRAFMALDPGAEDPAAGDYPADPKFGERIQGNVEFLLAHEMLPFIRYQPDVAALRAKRPKLHLGVAHYQAKVATRIVTTLATRLGTTATEFPSDHTGYMWRPREFAKILNILLAARG